jgi:hypothetical protein
MSVRNKRRKTVSKPATIKKKLRDTARNPDAILAALERQGIKNLRQLIEQMAERPAEAERVDLFGPEPERTTRPGAQRVPKVPITVNGITYDPKDISRFDGQHLNFVLQPAGSEIRLIGVPGNQFLRAVTEYFALSRVAQYLSSPHVLDLPSAGKNPPPGWQPSGDAQGPPDLSGTHEVPSLIGKFWTDANFQGDWLWLNAGFNWPNLVNVPRGTFHLGDWNDVITSVETNSAVMILYSDINFGAPVLIIPPSLPLINDLGVFGWNDRVSSIKNLGAGRP